MTYKEAVSYLLGVPKFTSKNPLEHTRELLRRLNDPQEKFRVLHVAGTNGKGSVCSYLERILLEGNKQVGMFTSPHLVRINERFRINGRECANDRFLCGFHKVMDVVREMEKENLNHPTFFELLFAMAMVIFQDEGMEYVILETGLGGRLDATNCVKSPLVTVITSIGLDHTAYLGDTILKIAAEKAGIIKPGVPVVCDGAREDALAVIEERAKKLGSPIYPLHPGLVAISKYGGKCLAFSFDSGYYKYTDIRLSTPGIYQAGNAALALLTYEVLKDKLLISRKAALKGIEGARWPGRMEELRPGVILDGAHNEDGVEAFLKTVAFMGTGQDRLLFAAAGDKDYENMIAKLSKSGLFCEVIVTEFAGGRAALAEGLYRLFKKYGTALVRREPDVRKAYHMALSDREQGGTLFIAGSLYLAGQIKELVKEEER